MRPMRTIACKMPYWPPYSCHVGSRSPIGALLTRLTSARAMDRLRQRYRCRIINNTEEQVAAIADPHDLGDTAQLGELRSELRIASLNFRKNKQRRSAFVL